MSTEKNVKKTINALSDADLTICGRLFESDSESVTITCDNTQYDILLDHIRNFTEIAKLKPGDPIEIHLSPDAKIVEKRLVSAADLRGVVTGNAIRNPGEWVQGPYDCSNCLCHEGPGYCDCICDWKNSVQTSKRKFARRF